MLQLAKIEYLRDSRQGEKRVNLVAPNGQLRVVMWDLGNEGEVTLVGDRPACDVLEFVGLQPSMTRIVLVYNDKGQLVRSSREL